jgi:hypothetical protein
MADTPAATASQARTPAATPSAGFAPVINSGATGLMSGRGLY